MPPNTPPVLEFDMFLRATPCAAIHPFVVLKRDFAIHLVGLKNVFRTLRQRGMARVFNAGRIAIKAVSVIYFQTIDADPNGTYLRDFSLKSWHWNPVFPEQRRIPYLMDVSLCQ